MTTPALGREEVVSSKELRAALYECMNECVRQLAGEKHLGPRQRGLPAPPNEVGIMRPKRGPGRSSKSRPHH